MTKDIETLRTWIRIVALVTAICTTAFPFIYSFFPWRSRTLGKVFMLQAVSFAIAMDMTFLFSIWVPNNILIIFWIDAVVLTLVAVSSTLMTVVMLRANYKPRKKGRHERDSSR